MTKKKNPAAVALGRRGGSVSGVKKGFRARPDLVAEISALGVAARLKKAGKQQPAPMAKAKAKPKIVRKARNAA